MTAGNTRLLKIRHPAVLGNIDGGLVPDDVLRSARSSWDEALAIGEQPGYRNAQATVLAPTGKISFVMDRDTTGIKPDLHS